MLRQRCEELYTNFLHIFFSVFYRATEHDIVVQMPLDCFFCGMRIVCYSGGGGHRSPKSEPVPRNNQCIYNRKHVSLRHKIYILSGYTLEFLAHIHFFLLIFFIQSRNTGFYR